jgi:heptosyltransferase-2
LKKILIIQTASIGDVILSTPLLENLHSQFPGAAIDLLVKKGMEGLFIGHPFLNRIITWDKSRKFSDLFRILREVRKTKYDLAVNIQRFALTGLLTFASGSAKTIGFDKNPFSLFFTERVKHEIKPGVHEVGRNLALIQPLLSGRTVADTGRDNTGNPDDLPLSSKPRLYPVASDKVRISAYIKEAYVTISPASLWFTKQYPAEKWVELIDGLPAGLNVFMLGARTDHSFCEAIRKQSGKECVINLSGTLSFLESAALIQGAAMNYTNDSAPMHLASAVNAPVAVVFCSTVPEFGFGPLSDNQTIIQTTLALKCRPCGLHGLRECPLKHFQCAWSISSGQFPLTAKNIRKI